MAESYQDPKDHTEGGVYIPAVVLHHYRKGVLSGDQAVLLGVISNLINDKHGCYASNKYLANRMNGKTARTVSAMIKRLEELGMVVVHRVKKKAEKRTFRREIYLSYEGRSKKKSGGTEYKVGYTPEGGSSGKTTTPKGGTVLPQNGDHSGHQSYYPMGNNYNTITPHSRSGRFLFGNEEEPTVGKFFKKCAEHLYENLPGRTKASRNSKPSKWAIHFQRLHEIDGVPKKKIKQVLKWYVEHQTNKYIPACTTGETFRKKFDNLVLAKTRMEQSSDSNVPVKVSAEAQKLSAKIKDTYPWPDEMDGLVQEAISSWGMLTSKHKGFLDALHQVFGNGNNFVTTWFHHWYTRYENWSDWSGKSSTVRCTYDSDKFRKYIEERLKEYTQRKITWK